MMSLGLVMAYYQAVSQGKTLSSRVLKMPPQAGVLANVEGFHDAE